MVKKIITLFLLCNCIARGMDVFKEKSLNSLFTKLSTMPYIESDVISHLSKHYWFESVGVDPADVLSCDPTGKYLATASSNRIRIVNMESGEGIKGWSDENTVRLLCFDPNGKYLATACDKFKVSIFDAVSGSVVTKIPHNEALRAICFDSRGKRIATTCLEKQVRICKVGSGEVIKILPHDALVRSVCFDSKGSYLATGGNDKKVHIFDAKSYEKIKSLSPGKIKSEFPYADSVDLICFDPSGRYLAAACDSGKVCIFDVVSGEVITSWLPKKIKKMRALCFDPSGKYLAGGRGKNAWIFDIFSGAAITRLYLNRWVELVCFDPTGKFFATISDSDKVRIFEGYKKWTLAQILLIKMIYRLLLIEKPSKKLNKIDLLLANVSHKFECSYEWVQAVMKTFPSKMQSYTMKNVYQAVWKFGKN